MRRTTGPREVDIQRAILAALRYDRRVGWVHRRNTGGAYLPGRGGKDQLVRFGVPGEADITGQLRDGRRLELEVKRPGGVVTVQQRDFLRMVWKWGGVSAVVRSVDEAMKVLDAACGPEHLFAAKHHAREDDGDGWENVGRIDLPPLDIDP